MSPGSSSHSSLGAKSASIFSGTSSRRRAPRARPMRQRRRPLRLEQEHVVRIDVRADAAAIARVRAHHVVEARIGHEAEATQQAVRGIVVQVDALHEQRPSGRAAVGSGRRASGPWRSDQRAAVARDQARLDVVLGRQREQARAIDRGERARQRAADHERLLLPMPAHEERRRQAAERGSSAGRDPWLIVR